MTTERTCPTCQAHLNFSGDGRALVCDRCGYRQPLDLPDDRPTLAAFREMQRLGHRLNTSNLRGVLRHGIASAKAGDWHEAAKYLETVLLSGADPDEEQEAWLWLSAVYVDETEKRECLEMVLAVNPAHGQARRDLAMLQGRLTQGEIINPDQYQQAPANGVQLTTAVQFQCPRCASPMNFTPDNSALQCDFCHYQEELTPEEQANLLAQLPLQPEVEPEDATPKQFGEGVFEQDFTAAIHTAKGHAKPVAMRVVQCQSCGVSYVLDPRTLSLTCAYCDSVYVTPAAETAELLPPQALLPFAFDKDEAKKRYRAWFKEHNFHKLQGVKVTAVAGVYSPVWTFDLSGNLNWNGLIRKSNRGWGAESDEWEPIRGEKYLFFDDHLVPASRAPSGVMFAALASYRLSELVAYDARYLADWPAERYTVKLSDAALQARQAVTQTLRRHPQKLVSNAYQIRDLRVNTQNLVVESYKLLLLPLWMVHYELNNKRYAVLLNGQTGEIFGEREQGFLSRFASLFKS